MIVMKRQTSDKMNTRNMVNIKNFKASSLMPEKFISSTWSKLENSVCAIQNSQKLEYSLQELYSCVENLCTFNQGAFLYENLFTLIDNHYKNVLLPSIRRELDFLGTMNYAWVTSYRQSILIKNVFLYLDKTFVRDKCLLSIENMSLSLFKENITLNSYVREKLIDGIGFLIHQERQGSLVDRNILKSLIEMLTVLHVYDVVFEFQFLRSSELLYKDEGVALINKYDIIQYLKHVKKRCQEEIERVNAYLNSYTKNLLMDVLINQLLAPHLPKILDSGLFYLMENDFKAETSLLYELLGLLLNGRIELCKAFSNYLKKRGKVIVIDPKQDKNMIQNLLNFKDRIDGIVSVCFENNEKFVNTEKDSFKFFINQRHNKPAELLAKYVDFTLKCKDVCEEKIEEILSKVMVLFRFVQGKDVFEAFYKRDLAKRLLVGKSTSQDAENSMISKLKEECGSGFTIKLEGMFKDITLSQGINNAFQQHLNRTQKLEGEEAHNVNISMCVNVLTSSYWPNYRSYEITFPIEMITYQNIFLKFYMGIHSGRKLQWQPSLGFCIVKAQFLKGRKELQVSLFQTVILLLFNNANKFSYSEIAEAINLEPIELKRTLQSLSCAKSRVLLKTPSGKDVENDDVFVLNDEFTDKLFRIKINQLQMKESIEEQRATEESVIQDRQFQIDAAIVRIMKQKKSLSHNLLITELYNILDIPVKPADLKKRIEQLIDRDYIERDQTNSTVYKYIA